MEHLNGFIVMAQKIDGSYARIPILSPSEEAAILAVSAQLSVKVVGIMPESALLDDLKAIQDLRANTAQTSQHQSPEN